MQHQGALADDARVHGRRGRADVDAALQELLEAALDLAGEGRHRDQHHVVCLQRGSGLVRRARWLLLSLLVVFSWGIPGDPLWNGALSPTYEGLFEGLTHLGRLVLVLMAVAAFLEAMSLQDLLAATHALLGPLRRLGFDPDRSVVRLMLVLRYVETLPRPRDWRALLDLPATNLGEVVEIGYQPFRWPDFVVVLTLAIAFLLYLYR